MKFAFFVFCHLVLISCSPKPKEDVVKDNIHEYLSKTMHDFKSYEAVEFGKLDSMLSSYHKTERYDSLKAAFHVLKEESEDALDNAKIYQWTNKRLGLKYIEESTLAANGMDSIAKLMKKESAAFKPIFIGYNIFHSFRGKNLNGATGLTSKYFILDSSMKVVGTEEIPTDNH
jgi:hypothetical protein